MDNSPAETVILIALVVSILAKAAYVILNLFVWPWYNSRKESP